MKKEMRDTDIISKTPLHTETPTPGFAKPSAKINSEEPEEPPGPPGEWFFANQFFAFSPEE